MLWRNRIRVGEIRILSPFTPFTQNGWSHLTRKPCEKLKMVALCVAGVVFCATGADANKEFRALTNAKAFQVTDSAPHAIPLTNDGSTSKTINLAATILSLSYNVECTADGPDGSYLAISILVDGLPAGPDSGDGSGFCSPAGPDSHTLFSVVRNAIVAPVASGKHTFQVIGTGVNTTSWQLRNMMLSITAY